MITSFDNSDDFVRHLQYLEIGELYIEQTDPHIWVAFVNGEMYAWYDEIEQEATYYY